MTSDHSRAEYSYLDLLDTVLHTGQYRPGSRTGVGTYGVFGGELVADLREGFPLWTTKKLPFQSIVAELLGFLRGYTNAADFRALGCKIWDQNANETQGWLDNPARKGTDDLGRIYGAQWREWRVERTGGAYTDIDQIDKLLHSLATEPYGRRHIVSAWNVGEIALMALPPCHVMFQCYVERGRDGDKSILHLKMTQRSADLFLGVPFNIASYALLLQMIATVLGMTPGKVTIDFGDLHIYESHIEQAQTQLRRSPVAVPHVTIDQALLDPDGSLARGSFHHAFKTVPVAAFTLHDYNPAPAIKAPMAA